MISRLAIGIDIGGTRTKIGLVNLSTGEVMHTIIRPTETKVEAVFLEQIGLAIRQLQVQAQSLNGALQGIGFGVPSYVYGPGIVDSTYGFLAFMDDYPLAAIVENTFQLRCRVDNDARVVALGEALYGRGRGIARVLVLTLGTGLGFGFVVNGQFTDSYPLAHMAGHLSILPDGPACYCGKNGCLEALVSSFGIATATAKRNWTSRYPAIPATAEAIFTAAAEGHSPALEIVAELTGYLHTGLHNYINLFAPDIIVLGGGISKGLAPYLHQLQTDAYLKPYKHYQVQITTSDLEEQAGVLGAASLFQLPSILNPVA